MEEEFDISESKSQSSFDVKALLVRILSYWKLFLLFIGIGIFIVYQQNIRTQQSYRLGTQISVEEESNPLFTSNTSLIFNWGGVSGKVQTMINALSSRSIHEKVVDNLEFYTTYLKQSRFRKDDIYTYAPFKVNLIPKSNQLLGIPIKITMLENDTFELSVTFESTPVKTQNFSDKSKQNIDVPIGEYRNQFRLGELITTPYVNGIIELLEGRRFLEGEEYFVQFNDFHRTVSEYRAKLSIKNPKNSAILNLSMVDVNKPKIVDYLNETVKVLSEDQLNRKNQFVTNTINFIDEQLARVKSQLTLNADSLNSYRQENKIFNLNDQSIAINNKLSILEAERDNIKLKLGYYASLKKYLIASNLFTDVPAPAVAGIEDVNILNNISKINALSVQKSKYSSTVRKDATIFADIDRQIEGLKQVLLENISSASNGLNRILLSTNSKIAIEDAKIRKLPKAQQKLFDIQRQYALSEQTYNAFLVKRGEADIIKSASVSDILVIDPAKDTGATPIDLKLSSRYLFAVLGGMLIPLLLAFVITFFDNKLHNPQVLEGLSNIPLLGVVGKNNLENNLAVHLKPKSTIAEAFRSIRSSLQYFYKKNNLEGAKTLMITSSVSGEGKTFCSINIATVFAMSGKKTVLVGLDLRKPKIFGDFDIENDIGVVNYLIGQKDLAEVIQETKVANLDVITSGPIPPNPSELLMLEEMDVLIKMLKESYDYIVLDTPPIGLVSDALELIDYVDATIYVVRQDYTKKGMITLIKNKYEKGEIKNLSFIYNGYNQKGKYGYGYGYSYGYGYGYGSYGNGYNDDDSNKASLISRIKSVFKKKF
ncbi:MAG: polysaccharide biosynthesis tyrosine autokinase [Algibacter sp.]|uniref:exopolysaccharide transport family protein n=1 Tax=Algibacter sp. TaxID=1872428 RepID=UPI00263747A3|nr:tyrosine-protein kinase family protein [Algibacter sp.]MDG2177406.1 polysaccharide biosynthesis tyrosine autokinase [Algibacter sp.]